MLAARARGHECCAGPFLLEIESMVRQELGLLPGDGVTMISPMPEA